MTLLLLALPLALAQEAPASPLPPSGELTTLVAEDLAPILPFSASLLDALAQRRHTEAAEALLAMGPKVLSGHQVQDRAFVLAWELIRADRAVEAVPLIEVVAGADHVPQPYLDLTLGELLLADGKAVEAAQAFDRVPPSSRIGPRAELRAAEAHLLVEAVAEAEKHYQGLIARTDPAEGSERALLALATRGGLGSAASRPLLKRLWTRYPATSEGRAADAALTAAGSKPTDEEVATRAEALMDASRFKEITDWLGPLLTRYPATSGPGCRIRYAVGRSHFKRNNVSMAAELLEPMGEACVGLADEQGALGFYIAGKSLERKKDWAGAARAYGRIPELYPASSVADDGYALAGIALQVQGEDERATALWEAQVEAYPDGDLAGQGFWRLAWTRYLAGDPEGAIRWAERLIWEVPMSVDPVQAAAARYWSARWRLYPDVASPNELNPDSESVAQGIDLLLRLCEGHPTSFYSLLAASRLYELAPLDVDALSRPAPLGEDGTWHLPVELVARPAVQAALALTRLGLVREAWTELQTVEDGARDPSVNALFEQIHGSFDPLAAHDALHHRLLATPPEDLGPDRDAILRLGFPDTWWDLVQSVSTETDWDPRIFHALVREESSFNPNAKSFAGARGLSQLMPATAKHVGGKLGIVVTTTNIVDPETNLRIGSTYLDSLHRRFHGNSFMAVPSYNAGEGNVEKWRAQFGDIPTDEFIERIPLKETRDYVKRVLGTYQIYRVLYDDGALFPDWSPTAHHTVPEL